MRKKVLILTNYYLPGVKGGGPIQSIGNLVDWLSDKIDFYILTSDRDVGDEEPYKNIKTNEWIQMDRAKLFYINGRELTLPKLTEIINNVGCDVIYLNSFFSFKFSIAILLLRKLNKIKKCPLVIAPRGEFSPGALKLKGSKKKLFINLARFIGLTNDVKWHATAELEKQDIERIFGKSNNISVARNLTANYSGIKFDKKLKKNIGELKVVFVSRIHPKKNLKKAIELLGSLDGEIDFQIYGPIEDKNYWTKCQKAINELPSNIKVTYNGLINHEEIVEMFNRHHVFLFPTLGENFGHVISEALIGGCPVIISDQTPWRGLEEFQVGWDIALENESKFISVLQQCLNMDQGDYDITSRKAFEYGKILSNRKDDMGRMLQLFITAN